MADRTAARGLPSVDRLITHPDAAALIGLGGRALAVDALRAALGEARSGLRQGNGAPPSDIELIANAGGLLGSWLAPTLRRAINATGVIIHTNLGRAPLSDAALEAIQAAGRGYSTLEYDLEDGKRGSRSVHAEELLRRISGAEAALVVNNNAAAVLLALTALAGPTADRPAGRGVVISRGQLVEIGGGFRIPDVMAQSGARLVEVGTTNRTRVADYEQAIDPDTAAILRAHRSNFALIGFTAEPTLAELAEVAHRHELLLLDDLGSGALLDTAAFGLAPEPMVQASLAAGADMVMFSGDKLLGGPQAGILAGRAAAIDRLRRHPLARAVRAEKLCLAGLAATLVHYLKGEALTAVPVWRMIGQPLADIQKQARRWARQLVRAGLDCQVIAGQSAIGGGSLPGETLPTALVAIRGGSADEAAARLRACDPPVIVRIEEGRLLVDPRTVLPRDEADLLAALRTLADQKERQTREI
jgi:L-seryl-tRNA(Ser) seleniumtransferase